MQVHRAVLILSLVAGSVLTLPEAGETPQARVSPVNAPMVVRVFYLHGIDPLDAMKLARSTMDARHLVIVLERNVLVEGDFADVVDRSEKLLRQHDAVVRAVDPHGPVPLERKDDAPLLPRVFRADPEEMKSVITILRAIYGLRYVEKSPEGDSVTVQAPQSILDASEALLRELKLIAG